MKAIDIEVDEHGSPLALEPEAWYVCFVPGLVKQWWHPFVDRRHKHVFALKPAGSGEWTLFEPWWQRILVSTITSEQARKFLLWGVKGDVLHVREAIPGRGSQIRGWMTCAALVSYLLGRPYWVWTPRGLFKRLLREFEVYRVDAVRLAQLTGHGARRATELIAAIAEPRAGGELLMFPTRGRHGRG